MGEDGFLRERVQAMYAAAAGANVINMALAALALVVTWPSAGSGMLGAWAAAVTASLGLRWYWLYRYEHAVPAQDGTKAWAGRLTFAMAISGGVWGIGSAVFYMPEQPLLMALWAILVCGIAAGAVHAAAYHLPAQRAYLLPLILPLALRHAWDALPDGQGRLEHGGIAFGLLCYLAFCLGQGRRQARLLLESLAVRHEKDGLLRALRIQTDLAEQARGRAEEAAQSKDRFFAAASHDLRQPLQALGFFAQALREQPGLPAQQPMVEGLDDSVKALDNLFTDILQIARLDAGAQALAVTQVPTGPLLERITRQMQPSAKAKGLRLACRHGPPDVHVLANATALERMVANLLANAIRYTDRGSVMVALRMAADQVRIQIRDSGRGIAAAEQARVFEEFYQSPTAAAQATPGVGLGLATVRRLAEAQGIGVSLRSCPGRGTTFTLRLDPATPPPVADTPHADPAPKADAQGDQVLQGLAAWVIDDERDVRESCAILLRQWGMRVTTAASLQDIERRLPDLPAPRVLICDDRLQDHRGLDAIAHLRRRWNNEVPALIVSGTLDKAHQARAAATGIPWLHKPVKPARLRATLLHLLTREPQAPSRSPLP